jgi:hypothetical protein
MNSDKGFPMTSRYSRRRRRAAFIDFLEGRTLLNAAHPAPPTAEVRVTDAAGAIHLKLTGTNHYSSDYFLPTSDPSSSLQVMVYDINAQGRAAHLGRVRLQASYNTASDSAAGFDAFQIWGGTGTLTDAYGDQLSLTFSGLSSGGKKITVNLNGAITGGTGSFAGVSGTLSATGRELPHGKIELNVTANT